MTGKPIPLTQEQLEAASAGPDHPQNVAVAEAKAAEQRDRARRRAGLVKRVASIDPELVKQREATIAAEEKLRNVSVRDALPTREGGR